MLLQPREFAVFLCALVIAVHAVSSPYEDDEQLFVELKTNSLTIPVRYRPDKDYTHLGPPDIHETPAVPTVPEPEKIKVNVLKINVTVTTTEAETGTPLSTPYHSSEMTTEESAIIEHGQGRGFGRSKKKPPANQKIGQQNTLSNSKGNKLDPSSDGKDPNGSDPKNEVQAPEPDETDAQHGDACNPVGALELDYCEKAKYPNKGRMVCATPDLHLDLAQGTCACKFAKYNSTMWIQMRYHKPSGVCRSPEGGRCYVKIPTDMKTESGEPLYLKNETKAHEQCDDDAELNSKIRTLKCSRPHPRRFLSYNAYHYYCLKKVDRLNLASGRIMNFSLIFIMLWISYFHSMYVNT